MRVRSALVVMAVTAAAIGSMAADQPYDGRIVSDRWYVSLGTSVTDFSTEAQIGLGSTLGTLIRIEDDLGLDDNKSVLRVNGFYNFNEKHSIDVKAARVSRASTSLLDEEFTIADPEDGELVTFLVGAEIDTAFKTDSVKLFYRYSFVNDGRTQAGIGAGLSVFDYRIELEGDAMVDDGSGNPVFVSDERVDESILAPVPSFLLFIDHAIKPPLVLRVQASFLDLDIGDIDGRLIETRFTLNYFFTRHFSLGLGIEGSDIDYRDRGGDPLLISVRESSLIAYVATAF